MIILPPFIGLIERESRLSYFSAMSVSWKCWNSNHRWKIARISPPKLFRWLSQLQNSNHRRVVITGMGVVCPLGCGLSKAWEMLLNGKSGIVTLEEDGFKGLPCRIAGRIPRGPLPGHLNLEGIFSKADVRSLSLASLFALVSADEAIQDASLRLETDDARRAIGVAFGAGMPDLEEIHSVKALNRVSPHFITRILPNMPAGYISTRHGLWGPNLSTSTACASGAHAIGDAFRAIKYGEANVMVCGGTEAPVGPLSMAAFSRMRALSTRSHSSPVEASRPFDAKRDGFVMSEGSGALILEELEHALGRGVPHIYAELVGYGRSSDAGPPTAPPPDGAGALRAMTAALKEAGLKPDDVGYINAHATSTPLGDAAESRAIKLLGGYPHISSTKGSHGHLLGAAGALESVFTVMAVNSAYLPPSLNLEEIGEDVAKDLNFVIGSKQEWERGNCNHRVALKNSFGFGGTNASLCFKEYKN
ncbi:3-oxoacyl-[acyl-carrier-protein] synthase, mitochondrial [Hetaerina americana]|uniref:3-oxoacyl-[acyl-carrier-protein] synthase, mitochondrial n=1 Tax=Hetaerina americana TaxID=62018 RepID=UPI003A7F525F